MNTTIFTVYWMYKGLHPNAIQFKDMKDALTLTEKLRREATEKQYSAITFCSENVDQVGRMGVDSIVDGRTPDGQVYDWNKSSRIGRTKGSRYSTPLISTDDVVVPTDDDEWMTIGLGKSDDE